MTGKRNLAAAALLAGVLAATPPARAQNENQGQGTAVITVLPKNDKAAAPNITTQDVHVKVDGKDATISTWNSLHGEQAPVELVLLIDGGARTSLGREWGDIQGFIKSLPPNVKIGLAYMQNGGARFSGPLTSDHARAQQELHLPTGVPGTSASPYFCLSTLAKEWPSQDPQARREVIMITDGVDYYHLQYDPDDPYVQAAINDSVRAHLVVYSIYWRSAGRVNRTWYENNAGQNLLLQVAQATGGNSYWQGLGNPESFSPYFDDFVRRLRNQYELGLSAPLHGKAHVESLKVKLNASDVKVTSPERVYLVPAGAGQQ
jgi:hypothetical protein